MSLISRSHCSFLHLICSRVLFHIDILISNSHEIIDSYFKCNRDEHWIWIWIWVWIWVWNVSTAFPEYEGIDIFLALLPVDSYRYCSLPALTICSPKLDIGLLIDFISCNIPDSAVDKEI